MRTWSIRFKDEFSEKRGATFKYCCMKGRKLEEPHFEDFNSRFDEKIFFDFFKFVTETVTCQSDDVTVYRNVDYHIPMKFTLSMTTTF